MFERSRKGEHALLIQPYASGRLDDGITEEFSDLARSAGASIAALITARIDRPAGPAPRPACTARSAPPVTSPFAPLVRAGGGTH